MKSYPKDNVDFSEIDKFALQAEQWWDTEGVFKPLHQLNPLRLSFIMTHSSLSQNKVLDVGCGGGILSEAMAAADAWVTGIDLALESLAVAEQHQQNQSFTTPINYKQITCEELAEEMPENFDIITCMEMLEHVPNPCSVIQACGRLVRPGGKVFFSTLNRNLKSYLSAIVGAEYILGLLPKGTHEYTKFIRPAELDKWARQANLSLQSLQGIRYNPFKKNFYLDKNIQVNYLACFAKE